MDGRGPYKEARPSCTCRQCISASHPQRFRGYKRTQCTCKFNNQTNLNPKNFRRLFDLSLTGPGAMASIIITERLTYYICHVNPSSCCIFMI